MFSLARASTSRLSKRAYSSASEARQRYKHNAVKNWLSDSSTYPVIGVVVVAVLGCSGFMLYKIMYCPDVRISKDTKGKVVRTWQN